MPKPFQGFQWVLVDWGPKIVLLEGTKLVTGDRIEVQYRDGFTRAYDIEVVSHRYEISDHGHYGGMGGEDYIRLPFAYHETKAFVQLTPEMRLEARRR